VTSASHRSIGLSEMVQREISASAMKGLVAKARARHGGDVWTSQTALLKATSSVSSPRDRELLPVIIDALVGINRLVGCVLDGDQSHFVRTDRADDPGWWNDLRCGSELTITPAPGTVYRPAAAGEDGLPTSVQLDSGALRIEFNSKRRREFQILTPQAIASVRGTKWAMEVKPGQTSTLRARYRSSRRERRSALHAAAHPATAISDNAAAGERNAPPELTMPEPVLLFCLVTDTDWFKAGGTPTTGEGPDRAGRRNDQLLLIWRGRRLAIDLGSNSRSSGKDERPAYRPVWGIRCGSAGHSRVREMNRGGYPSTLLEG
jgi:FecR protein